MKGDTRSLDCGPGGVWDLGPQFASTGAAGSCYLETLRVQHRLQRLAAKQQRGDGRLGWLDQENGCEVSAEQTSLVVCSESGCLCCACSTLLEVGTSRAHFYWAD